MADKIKAKNNKFRMDLDAPIVPEQARELPDTGPTILDPEAREAGGPVPEPTIGMPEAVNNKFRMDLKQSVSEISAGVDAQIAREGFPGDPGLARGLDFTRVLIDAATGGVMDEAMALMFSSRPEGKGFQEALKGERAQLEGARRRSGEREAFGISAENVADVIGFGVAGLLPEIRGFSAVQKFATKVSSNIITSVTKKVGPEQAAVLFNKLPIAFQKVGGGNARARAIQLVVEGGISGAGFSQPEDLKTLIDGLGSGLAISSLLGVAVKGLKISGKFISGMSDEGGQAVFRFAKKKGLNLNSRSTKVLIISNFEQSVGRVEKQLEEAVSGPLSKQRQEILAANVGREVNAGPSFGETLKDLKKLSSTDEALQKQLNKTTQQVNKVYGDLRLPSASEVETIPSGIGVGRIKTSIPKKTTQVSFEALDDYKQALGKRIFEDQEFIRNKSLNRAMVNHYFSITRALEKVDVTKNLKGLNEVFTATFKAKNKLPTVAQFASGAKGSSAAASSRAQRQFDEALNGPSEATWAKYAPELRTNIYADVAPHFSDVVALQAFQKEFLTLPVVGKIASKKQLTQKLGQLAGAPSKRAVLGRGAAAGAGAVLEGIPRRAGGPALSQEGPKLGEGFEDLRGFLGGPSGQ